MRYAILSMLSSVAVTAAATAADERGLDYRKIDRSIGKEPKYESDEPLYALMVFGREAAFRVWIVLDGETVYIDSNGDGDLTAEDERFATIKDCREVDLRVPVGKARYTIAAIGSYEHGEPPKIHLMPSVKIAGPLEYEQYAGLTMENSPREANVAHFDGPLTAGPDTIDWESEGLKLTAGTKPSEIYGIVGTLDKEAGCWVVVQSHNGKEYAFQKGIVPQVEIEFPGEKPGDPVLKKRYPLDGFC